MRTIESISAISNLSSYLYSHEDEKEYLNIKLLVEHVNSIGDKNLDIFFETIFSKGYRRNPDIQKRINRLVEGWLEAVNEKGDEISDERFKFWLQVTTKSSFWLQKEAVTLCAQLKEQGKRKNCFEYISEAKSSKIRDFAASIKTYKEKQGVI